MLRTNLFINLVRNINVKQRTLSTCKIMHNKYFENIDDAIKDVKDGSMILMGKWDLTFQNFSINHQFLLI